jgi:hypothetical protein
MTACRQWKIRLYSTLFGSALFAVVVYGLLGKRPGDNPMNKSGFMIDHVRLESGNPLIALQMTQHDIRASLYAPLRVLVYENADGKTCIEYDKPSSLFGQFGNAEVDAVAAMLDRKLEALVAGAFE